MRAADVREFVRRQPFQPFRITLTDGRTYDVVHPELAMVGHRVVAVGLPRANGPNFIFDRLVTVSFLHIMQIEPIPSDTTPANGPPATGA
jgi:hypothetical protein